MTTDAKPTQELVAILHHELEDISQKIRIMINYHNKRTSFFKGWDFTLNIINAVFGVGALFFIGLKIAYPTLPIITTSLLPATITVFLLFLGKLLDFSKKEGNHRWLATIYISYNKEITDMTSIIWSNLTEEDYRKWKDLHVRMKGGVSSLKKVELPILEFEYLLCTIKAKIAEKKQGALFLQVNGWRRFWANYFSMTNARARFIAKHKYKG